MQALTIVNTGQRKLDKIGITSGGENDSNRHASKEMTVPMESTTDGGMTGRNARKELKSCLFSRTLGDARPVQSCAVRTHLQNVPENPQ